MKLIFLISVLFIGLSVMCQVECLPSPQLPLTSLPHIEDHGDAFVLQVPPELLPTLPLAEGFLLSAVTAGLIPASTQLEDLVLAAATAGLIPTVTV